MGRLGEAYMQIMFKRRDMLVRWENRGVLQYCKFFVVERVKLMVVVACDAIMK